nr:unnamed protein product [Callosobruchus chinensis]
MGVLESMGVPEPQWILEKTEGGRLFWRRDTEEKRRVKFRCDVDVKEFHRAAHELEECDWSSQLTYGYQFLNISLTCAFCIAITVVLPWYILLGKRS